MHAADDSAVSRADARTVREYCRDAYVHTQHRQHTRACACTLTDARMILSRMHVDSLSSLCDSLPTDDQMRVHLATLIAHRTKRKRSAHVEQTQVRRTHTTKHATHAVTLAHGLSDVRW